MMKKDKVKNLYGAIESQNLVKVRELLEDDTELLNIETPFGTWLHLASEVGDIAIVKFLIEKGLKVNKKSGIGNAFPIKNAATEGHVEIVKFLLSIGAKMDTSEPERNPLFGATHFGHLDIVKLLIKAGIDYKVKYTGKSMKNMDALAFATEMGQTKVADYLRSLK